MSLSITKGDFIVTVSHLVKKYVDEMPFLHECIGKKLVNYGSVAELLKPRIEKELGKQVKLSAVMMALRRYSDEVLRKFESDSIRKVFIHGSEINMKSGLCDITVLKSGSLFKRLNSLYNHMDYSKGDILNIIHGNFNVTIISNGKHKEKILEFLKGEKITNMEDNLTQVSLKFPKEFLYTPGVLYMMTKELLWNNVNLIEIISSLTELNFMVKNRDAVKAYAALENLVSKSGK